MPVRLCIHNMHPIQVLLMMFRRWGGGRRSRRAAGEGADGRAKGQTGGRRGGRANGRARGRTGGRWARGRTGGRGSDGRTDERAGERAGGLSLLGWARLHSTAKRLTLRAGGSRSGSASVCLHDCMRVRVHVTVCVGRFRSTARSRLAVLP